MSRTPRPSYASVLTRRRLLAGSGATAAAVFAAACGGSTNNGSSKAPSTASGSAAARPAASTSPAPAAAQTATAQAAAQSQQPQKERDLIRVGLGSEPATVDPVLVGGGGDTYYLNNIFDSLYNFGPNDERVPALAQSFEVSPDGLQITFKVRQGVTFHNGDPFTAADVAFSVDRTKSPYSHVGSGFSYKNIVSTQVVDDATVLFKLQQPSAGFVFSNFQSFSIMPKAYITKVGDDEFGKNPVGTGPFKLTNRTPGTGATMDRFESFWGGKSGFKRVEFRVVPDATARVQSLRTGELDAITAIPPEQVQILAGVSGVKPIIQKSNTDLFYKFALNLKPDEKQSDLLPALQDVRVRQALNYAVDKKALAHSVYGDSLSQPYALTWPSQSWDVGKDYAYDPKKAKDLLAAAGAAGLQLPVFELAGDRLPGMAQVNAAVTSNWRDAGVKVAENAEEYQVWINRHLSKGAFNSGALFAWGALGGNTKDPISGVQVAWECAGSTSNYCSTGFDALLQQADRAADQPTQIKLLKQAFTQLFDDAPAVWLVLLQEAHAIRTAVVSDWVPNSRSSIIRVREMVPA